MVKIKKDQASVVSTKAAEGWSVQKLATSVSTWAGGRH
jgi:hypothetical protein